MHKRTAAGLLFVSISAFLFLLLGIGRAAAQPVLPAATPFASAGFRTEDAALATRLIQGRRDAYQAQLDELGQRIAAANALVGSLAAQEQVLAQQLAELQQARRERAAAYQDQLNALQADYAARTAQYTAQLQDAQARLSAANAQLGR